MTSSTSLNRRLLLAPALAAGLLATTALPASATTSAVRPPNDRFANAITLPFEATSEEGSNVNATGETGEPDHAGVSAALQSVWYKLKCTSATDVILDTEGSDFDTTLAVYRGVAVGGLTPIVSNDDIATDVTSEVQFLARANVTYWIAVDGYRSAQGNYVLNVDA